MLAYARGLLRLAFRDLRGDLSRFGIFLACLALGVGTIALVGSVSAALQAALTQNARLLLGGDMVASLSYRAATEPELAYLKTLGPLSTQVSVMGRATANDETAFLSLRAVDNAYPLVGTADIEAEPGAKLADLLAPKDGISGIVTDSLLLDRLQLKLGDQVAIGKENFAIRGVIHALPDSLSNSMQFGIPVLLSIDALPATGILGPGVLARFQYKLLLGTTPFDTAAAGLRTAFPDAGWQIDAPSDATTDLARFFTLFGRFLVIVGLSSLVVGGVGVSSAISAYVTERQRAIATFKALGATGARLLTHYAIQLTVLSVIGITLGLILGAVLTLVALPIIGGLVGLPLSAVIDLPALLVAAGFGGLTAFAFGLVPLWRVLKLRPAMLFRSAGAAVEGGIGWRDLLSPGLVLPLLASAVLFYELAVLTTKRAEIVAWYMAGAVGGFLVLRLAAYLLQLVIRILPPLPGALLRNAMKAIARPGAPAPIVVLSLGLGLALLLLIALVDGNLRHQLDREALPNAPSFAFMDLFDDEVTSLQDWSKQKPNVEDFKALPMLRGTLSTVDGTKLADLGASANSDVAALMDQEVPLTFSATLPDYSTISEGTYWPADYKGPPEVSVASRLQRALGLTLGQKLDFLIAGETVSAVITSFRDITWRDGSVNFSFVFSPGTFDDFSVSSIGLLKVTNGTERATQKELVDTFPDLVFLPTSEAVATFASVLGNITTAVEVIGGLAVASGALVLAGAMLAGRRQREADAVVMKVMGATRGGIVSSYIVEYATLGLLSALFATGLALVGTWAFVTHVLEIDLFINFGLVLGVTSATVLLTVAVGVTATWSALSVRPARFLREE
jgi:putative ABC transport system permease protein